MRKGEEWLWERVVDAMHWPGLGQIVDALEEHVFLRRSDGQPDGSERELKISR